MANKSIGQFIAALRKTNGLTQQEVAERLNVSNKAVSRWERDECSPDLSAIPALAEMFGVTCDELLKGERILDPAQPHKKELRVEKQLKSIVNRAIFSFKTMIWISLALSVVGIICMFGISYGFYRPIIGFAVMSLFEVAAVVVAAIATNRMKEIKTDNELFENADSSLLYKFNKIIGSFSFLSFYAVFCAILLSVPLVIVYDHYRVESVITIQSYVFGCLWAIVLILFLVYLTVKERYIAWVTERQYMSKYVDSKIKQMTFLQIGAVVLAAIAFIIAPYFETDPYHASPAYIAIDILGIVFLVINIICFIVFAIKCKNDRKQILLPGIRNMLMIVSAFLVSGWHGIGFMSCGAENNCVWEKYHYWQSEYLIYSIGFALFVTVVFKVIYVILKKKSKK